MCGIVGIVSGQPVNQALFDALTVLQHRGQDAAGIATCEGKHFSLQKGLGLVRDVFHTEQMQLLRGNIGMGHVRYPTAGGLSASESQPLYVNSPFGIALAHNGNLTNAEALQEALCQEDLRHINTHSDSEVMLNVFAHELQKVSKTKLTPEHVFEAVFQLHKRCRGGYAVVAMIAGFGLLAFRDPFGIRPLIYGERETAGGKEVAVASESVALKSLGLSVVRDIAPGEALFIESTGQVHVSKPYPGARLCPCLFEYVYFARPDSVIDGVSVYQVRQKVGKKLAEKLPSAWRHDIEVVIPVPETGRHAAIALAQSLQLELQDAFVKNRYVGRTFIMPGQKIRRESVRQKLHVIDLAFRDRKVLLVDDSIVRGTTSREIVQMVREAGAQKVYLALTSPPVRFPNIYGIDMPLSEELIAYGKTLEEIQSAIGVDGLFYLDLTDLISVVQEENPHLTCFESAVFDGIYLTGDESRYLAQVARYRKQRIASILFS